MHTPFHETLREGTMHRTAGLLLLTMCLAVNAHMPIHATPIRILVVYTPAAQTASGGTISTIAYSSVEVINSICSLSGISGVQCDTVGCREVDYDESPDQTTNINRLTDTSDGYMDEVHFLRYQLNAQVVVLLVDNNSAPGTVGDYNQNANIQHAFAVVRWDYANLSGWWVLAHEVGYLMGGQHEHGNSAHGAWNGQGAILPRQNGNIRTLMCNNQGGEQKVLRWSGH